MMKVEFNKLAYLLIGVLVTFFSGIIYAWSILKVPLQNEFNWTASQIAFNYTLTMCMFCIGGVVSGIFLFRTRIKIAFLIAGILSCIGFILASTVKADNIIILYLSYGVMSGLGIGIGYNSIISVINEWFPEKSGTCSGILLMSFGASALILGNIANSIMFPSIGWRATYRLLGIFTGIVLLLASVVIHHPRQEIMNGKEECTKNAEQKNYTTMEMIRRPTFFRFFLFLVLACAIGNSVISISRDVAVSVGASTGLAAVLAGILSLCNGVGRLVAGVLFDRCGQRMTMIIDGLITIIAPTVLFVAVSTGSLYICAAGLCLSGFSYSFQPPVTSSVIYSFYGSKNFSVNYSITNLMMIPASFSATLIGLVFTMTGDYIAPFTLLVVFSLISFVLNLSIRHA